MNMRCSKCYESYSVSSTEGAVLQCPHCKSSPFDLSSVPARLLQMFYGIDYGVVDCVCAHCGTLNQAVLVPDEYVFTARYAQTLADPNGDYKTHTKCIHCEKEYIVAFDS